MARDEELKKRWGEVVEKLSSKFADGEILRENMDEGYAKFYDKLNFNDKKVEMKKRREMYGRYYLLKKYFDTIENPANWISRYDDNMLIAPPKTEFPDGLPKFKSIALEAVL